MKFNLAAKTEPREMIFFFFLNKPVLLLHEFQPHRCSFQSNGIIHKRQAAHDSFSRRSSLIQRVRS